jgi:hypothetical protein
MIATTIPKHGAGLRLVGYVLAVPSAFLLLIITVTLFIRPGGAADPGMAGAAGCVSAIFYGLLIIPLAISLVLLGNRKVWKCKTCGYVFDRG